MDGLDVYARLLREIMQGETLVVVRLDWLARSVSHLLDVIEQMVLSALAPEFQLFCRGACRITRSA